MALSSPALCRFSVLAALSVASTTAFAQPEATPVGDAEHSSEDLAERSPASHERRLEERRS